VSRQWTVVIAEVIATSHVIGQCHQCCQSTVTHVSCRRRQEKEKEQELGMTRCLVLLLPCSFVTE